jgi:hypothetical protein
VAVHGINGINGDSPGNQHLRNDEYLEEGCSAGNYQLIDEEYSGRMDFLMGIPARGRGIYRRKGILPEITSS